MHADVTTLPMPLCGVFCVGGLAASLCVTVLGVGTIIVLMVALVRDYLHRSSFYSVKFDKVFDSEHQMSILKPSVSEKAYVEISQVAPPIAPTFKTATSDQEESGDENP